MAIPPGAELLALFAAVFAVQTVGGFVGIGTGLFALALPLGDRGVTDDQRVQLEAGGLVVDFGVVAGDDAGLLEVADAGPDGAGGDAHPVGDGARRQLSGVAL
jgi:hypothetical protein